MIKRKPYKYFLMAQFGVEIYMVSSHVHDILPWCEIMKQGGRRVVKSLWNHCRTLYYTMWPIYANN
jgi:hypothetical protein